VTSTSIDVANEPAASSARAGKVVAAARITVGAMWLARCERTVPRSFTAVKDLLRASTTPPNEVFAPYSWLVKKVLLPHFTGFGWTLLALEILLGAFLMLGLATRLFAALGALVTVPIAMTLSGQPGRSPWLFIMVFIVHLLLWAIGAGRSVGVDGLLRPSWAARTSRSAQLMLRVS
jgi:thiosulfate dehydrogenase [quinone] large subunit